MNLNFQPHSLETSLNPFFKHIDEGLLLTDPSFHVVYFNETAERLYGVKRTDIIGRHVQALRPDLKFQDMLQNREFYKKERTHIREHEVAVNKGLVELSQGLHAAYAVLHPVDSFKYYQLNSLLENPYEAIVVFNQTGKLVYANQVCYQYLKCSSEQQIESILASLLPPQHIEQSIQHGKALRGENIKIQGKNIELLYLPIIRNSQSIGLIIKSIPRSNKSEYQSSLSEHTHKGSARYTLENIVGENPFIIQQKEIARKAARSSSTILINGESGTGKEIFAHAIHNLSPRMNAPFIKVNCAAVPESLLESELFGYAEGAFTGALKEGKAGKFELADKGSIFLDEVADMSLSMQAKLLRVLQEKEVERIGASQSTSIDVRVIAATNQDLNKLVTEKKFRKDLFYRLNVIIIEIPPLRKRIDDIATISNILIKRINDKLSTAINEINTEVIDAFKSYDWPGNVRELENVLERAINFCNGTQISKNDIPEYIMSQQGSIKQKNIEANSLEKLLEEREKEILIHTLDFYKGNKSKTARALAIHRSVLYRKIEKYRI